LDIERFKAKAKLRDRYAKQLARLQKEEIPTACIEAAVDGVLGKVNVSNAPLVIYGEPQSGKTEMMICLTARLLDAGHRVLVHLMNDSLDLLRQNLDRFKKSGLAPAARNSSELQASFELQETQELVVFCKKNPRDLQKLIERFADSVPVVVIDDEADYATPNATVNQGTKTRINALVGQLIGDHGYYVGVTATPARLDLNNTFGTDAENWVWFPPHNNYTGQDVFFPVDTSALQFRLTFLDSTPDVNAPRQALVRFLVTVAYLNQYVHGEERNYTMLVHTSGKKQDHEADRATIEQAVQDLVDTSSEAFEPLINLVHATATQLFPDVDPDHLTEYVISNASRATLVVLNSERDRQAAGDNATTPPSPFTVIIGGNIVSRGVTFPNLLSMYFTRNVAHKIQQDTYIQRARMFGARGAYLKYFELTIPEQLYLDWHRCFIFHRLALETVKAGFGPPVWIGDKRMSIVASASIDKATVVLDKGEMAFGLFEFSPQLDTIVEDDQSAIATLEKLRAAIGDEALPLFLIRYIETVMPNGPSSLAIHASSSIEKYKDANQSAISRDRGFMGNPQLELNKFKMAVHHIKILRNGEGKARLFYKYKEGLQFAQNTRKPIFG
jgi:hypothetical protein